MKEDEFENDNLGNNLYRFTLEDEVYYMVGKNKYSAYMQFCFDYKKYFKKEIKNLKIEYVYVGVNPNPS